MAKGLKSQNEEVEGLYYLYVANTKVLICVFVFTYAEIRFSHDAAHLQAPSF